MWDLADSRGTWRIQEGSGAEGEPWELQKVLGEEPRESPGVELGSGLGSGLDPGWIWVQSWPDPDRIPLDPVGSLSCCSPAPSPVGSAPGWILGGFGLESGGILAVILVDPCGSLNCCSTALQAGSDFNPGGSQLDLGSILVDPGWIWAQSWLWFGLESSLDPRRSLGIPQLLQHCHWPCSRL